MEIFEQLRVGAEVQVLLSRADAASEPRSTCAGERQRWLKEGGVQTPVQGGATLKWRSGRELCTRILGGAALFHLSRSAEIWRGSSADWTLLQFCLSN